MSEVPTPVSESTAIEIVRKEGSTFSAKSVSTISAGDLVYWVNNSGLAEAIESVANLTSPGIALYDAVSGSRCVTIRGHLRARWDGAGTVNKGSPIAPSATYSGMFTLGVAGSGTLIWGLSVNNLGTSNSGQLCEVII